MCANSKTLVLATHCCYRWVLGSARADILPSLLQEHAHRLWCMAIVLPCWETAVTDREAVLRCFQQAAGATQGTWKRIVAVVQQESGTPKVLLPHQSTHTDLHTKSCVDLIMLMSASVIQCPCTCRYVMLYICFIQSMCCMGS